MVSSKVKSGANRVSEIPRAAKHGDFKVYSDLDKASGRGGDLVDESGVRVAGKKLLLRKSLPVKKGNMDCVGGLKVFDETVQRVSSVKAKAGRRALADVSNIKNSSLRPGVTNGSKIVRTTTKSLIPARKSFPVKKENLQTDSGDVSKGCSNNSRKDMGRRYSSVKVKSRESMLPAPSAIRNNSSSSSTGGSNRSKTIRRIHNGKSLFAPRAEASRHTSIASVPPSKLVMGTSKAIPRNSNKGVYTLKKAENRDVLPLTQKSKGSGLESLGAHRRTIVRKPPLTRKSLPVFGRINQIDSESLQDSGKKGKSVRIKFGRKVVPDVSRAKNSVCKYRPSDSFLSGKDRSGRRSLLQGGIPLGQDTVFDVDSSGKSPKVTVTSSKVKEETTMSRTDRRQSFTSSFLAKLEVSRECSEIRKKEKLPCIDDKQNHLDVAEYIEDIYQYYWVMEAQYPSISNYMTSQTQITQKMRGILINWLIEVHLKFGLMQETLFLMVALFDRFLSVVTIDKNEMQLVGLTSLLLASKYEDFWHPKVLDLISISADSYTRDDMLAMEKLILKKLKFRLNTPTPYVFMLRFLRASQSDKKLEHLAFYLIELCLTEYEALKYKPSLLCASAIYVARCTLRVSPTWSPLLCKHARYSESNLRECANLILRFHKAAGKGQLKVTYEKYLHPDQSSAARIKVLDKLPQ